MVPCTTAECPVYRPTGKAKYALEVNRDEPLTQVVGGGWRLEYQAE
jgi:uncharacterized membrane protein (UPF0127 family)